MPSIEVAAKIAEALSVTLDYLVKDGEYEQLDSESVNKLKEIEILPPEEKNRIFHFIDLIIRDHKAGMAYASK